MGGQGVWCSWSDTVSSQTDLSLSHAGDRGAAVLPGEASSVSLNVVAARWVTRSLHTQR